MKATLEFDLPEDDWALKAAEQGQDCRIVLRNVLDHIRAQLKYSADLSPEKAVTLGEIQAKVYEELSDFGIDLDAD